MFPTKSKLDEMHHMNFKMKKPNDPKLETHPMIRPQKSNTLFESPLMKFTKQSNLKISDKVAENFKSIGLKSDAKAAKEAAEQKAFSALRTSCRSSSGYTKILTQNKTYDWIVESIRSFRPDLSDGGKPNGFIDIRSPTFSLLSDNDTVTQWHLFIRFGEFKNGQPSDHASIWLVLEEFSKGETGESESACCSDERENIKACFEVRIMNDKGKIEQVLKSGYRLFTLNQVDHGLKATWGFSQFIPYSEFDNQQSRLFTGDKLRIKLELKIYQGSVNFPFPQRRLDDNRRNPPEMDSCSNDYGGSGDHSGHSSGMRHKSGNDMTRDIGTLWKNPQFADIEIVVRDTSFPVHKAILTARSRVFHKMLGSESFSESQDSVINLDTLSPSVVENMLQFIYTDSAAIPKECDDICELLEAAEMYELFPLKYDCYYELISRLDITNISKIVVIAYHYRPTDEIMAVIKEYLHNNLDEIIATKTFGDFFKQFKQAFVDILSPDALRNITSLKQ